MNAAPLLGSAAAPSRRPGPQPSPSDRPQRTSWLVRGLVLLAMLSAGLLIGAVRADAAPSPAPPSSAVDSGCAGKAPAAPAGSVAWCMPWAVHVDKPAPGGRSHWVTQCSKATTDADRRSCAAASITVEVTPRDGTASVLMDGPSTGKGPAGLINCGLLADPSTSVQGPGQGPWSLKQLACAKQTSSWAKLMYDPDPKRPDCDLLDETCKVQQAAQDAVSSGIHSGIQGLVDVAVQGTVFLISKLASWIFKVTAISSPDEAFYSTYNSLAGMLIVLIFVFFIISTIINGLRTTAGPSPVSTLGGLVRAVLGISFAGGIAYTIVAAWDQATNAVLDANARTPWDPSWMVKGLTGLTAGVGTLFLALLLSLMATLGLVVLFVTMLFRGLLTTGAALFGAMAMTGQVMPETRHWGRRWFWTINALGSSKFFIAELWIYGSRSAYESDSVMNALRAVLLIWLMVAAPWILLRLTSLWDGYLSDVNAHGLLSVAGNPLEIGADFVDGARGAGGDSGSSGGSGDSGASPGSDAAGVMDENTAQVPTTPGAELGEAAGISDGKGREAADAAATGADGGKVGEPAQAAAGQEQAGQEHSGAGDGPNAQETDGIQAGSTSAEHDIAAGQLTAPGDATGAHGSLPVTPAGAQGADPTGGDLPGDGSQAGSSEPAPDAMPDLAAAGAHGAGGDPTGAVPGASDAPATPDSAGEQPKDDSGSAHGEQPDGAAAAGSGSSEDAAAVAADVAII
jgi:hypothetical protein